MLRGLLPQLGVPLIQERGELATPRLEHAIAGLELLDQGRNLVSDAGIHPTGHRHPGSVIGGPYGLDRVAPNPEGLQQLGNGGLRDGLGGLRRGALGQERPKPRFISGRTQGQQAGGHRMHGRPQPIA